MKRIFSPVFFIAIFLFFSCGISYRPQTIQYNNYRINTSQKQDSALTFLLRDYSDSINKSMNDVLGYNEALMERKQRGNSLGFFITDAYLYMARKKFNTTVDAAFMNYGGIRLPELPAGNITRGKIYELMPFDNLLLLLVVKGSVLKQYLDTLAAGDGVIVSGITMQIKSKTAFNIMVGGKALDENAEYVIANSDYSINNSSVLKAIPQKNIGYLQRDALLDYVILMKQQGKNISVSDVNRISYVE
ncbi:MAG: hypothetical protein EPN92_13775 [Chitinophagaceae bacterium]|nr:MAG: hypothetical protein EPN92_13775 [Chitinophagaceae bacterium]